MGRYRVLIVDDDPALRLVIGLMLKKRGIEGSEAGDLAEAWDCLRRDDGFDAVLLDRGLPDGDGMALLQRIKETSELAHLPVILQTAADRPDEILQGLRLGAFYYLTKPFKEEMLHAVVGTALQDQARLKELREALQDSTRTLRLLERGYFKVRSVQDAHGLTSLLANACRDPESVAVGLSELMVNAVVHGNLELTYAETTECLNRNRLADEIASRMEDPRYRERWVDVGFERLPGRIRFTIEDQGKGFDWKKYIDFSPDRIFDNHGRGIAMARNQSFTRVEYLGCGNTVVAEVDEVR